MKNRNRKELLYGVSVCFSLLFIITFTTFLTPLLNLKIFSWLYLIISCITIGIVTTVFLIIRAETDEPKVKKKVVHRRRIKKVKKVKVRKVRKVKVKKATKVRRRRKKKVTDKPIEQVTKEVTPSTEVVQ